jgi:hypothetical protein
MGFPAGNEAAQDEKENSMRTGPWNCKQDAVAAYKETGKRQAYWRPGRTFKTPIFSGVYYYPRVEENSEQARKAWKTIRKVRTFAKARGISYAKAKKILQSNKAS